MTHNKQALLSSTSKANAPALEEKGNADYVASETPPALQLKASEPIQRFRLSEDDQENYPRLAYYLQNNIAEILNNRRIMRGLLTYGQLSREQVEEHVEWESGPLITVTDLEGANGEFSPNSDSDELRIDLDIVQQLQDAGREDSNAALLLVGSTMLHEYTHYGDDQDGEDYVEGHGEEGQAFEEYTYGRDIDNMEDAQEVIEEYQARRSR